MNTIRFELTIKNEALKTTVIIDNARILWSTVDLYQFFLDFAYRGIIPTHYNKSGSRQFHYAHGISVFEPFTCSCGMAGCAGIWSGIMTKHRKSTIEWRSKEEDGYTFLNRFYSFERQQYAEALADAYKQLRRLYSDELVDDVTEERLTVKEYFESFIRWNFVKTVLSKI